MAILLPQTITGFILDDQNSIFTIYRSMTVITPVLP